MHMLCPNVCLFFPTMMPFRHTKIYIILLNSKQNKFVTERIPQLITKKN